LRKRKFYILFFIVFFLFITINANIDCFSKEKNINDAEFWLSLTEEEKIIYMRALRNGMSYGEISRHMTETDYVSLYSGMEDNKEYSYALDMIIKDQFNISWTYPNNDILLLDTITEFYKNKSNRYIEMPNAIGRSIRKIKGLDTEELYVKERKKESAKQKDYDIDSVFWENLNEEEKAVYMNGFEIGIIYIWGDNIKYIHNPHVQEKLLEKKYDKILWVYQDNIREIKDMITDIYEDPENKFLNINSLVNIITKSINGESIDLLLVEERESMSVKFAEKRFKENQAKLQTTSELSYILESIEKFAKMGVEKADTITNNYIEEMENIGVNNILNPIWFKNNVAGKESHDIVKKGLDIIAKYKTRNINMFNEMFEEIDNLEIKQEYKNIMEETFKEEMPRVLDVLEKKWDLDKRILIEGGKILDFFINNREEWKVENQKITFYDENDLIEYNSYLSNIQKFVIKQEELNKENNKRIDRYFRLMKEDIEKIYQK